MNQLDERFSCIPDAPAVGESESNGTIERAVQSCEGTIRALKFSTEKNYDIKIDDDSQLLPWMVDYAGVLETLFQVGGDGLTAWERSRGKPWTQALPEFGESIEYLPLVRKVARDFRKENNLMQKYKPGIYVGFNVGRDEFCVLTEEGAARARAFKRRAVTDRFDKTLLANVETPVEASSRQHCR